MTHPSPASVQRPAGRGAAPWLVGCGVVTLIVLVAVGALAWWFVVRPIGQVAQAAQDVARIGQIDARVTNRAAFAAPGDGALTADQVDRYVAVLRRVRGDLEGSYRTMEARYAEIDGRRPEWSDIPRLAGAYADFLGLLVEAKESQVAALNAEGFSLEEYAWVRGATLQAAGLPGSTYDLGAFVNAVTGDGRLDERGVPAAVPEANRALMERLGDDFGELAFLAVLGL
jgi:hypothetical protein